MNKNIKHQMTTEEKRLLLKKIADAFKIIQGKTEVFFSGTYEGKEVELQEIKDELSHLLFQSQVFENEGVDLINVINNLLKQLNEFKPNRRPSLVEAIARREKSEFIDTTIGIKPREKPDTRS